MIAVNGGKIIVYVNVLWTWTLKKNKHAVSLDGKPETKVFVLHFTL